MQSLIDWIRSVLILYFLMMIVLYFAAGERYKKFIRFFMGLVLALTLLRPLIQVLGKEETLRESITYEAFRQDLKETQFDVSHLEETEQEIYRSHYERVLVEQFLSEAKERLLEIRDISVAVNEACELEQVTIQEELYGDGETLKKYLMEVYGLEEGQVYVQ